MAQQVMLTTVDNPYDPFDEFKAWLAFDTYAGYNTCGLLARVTVSSSELPMHDQDLARTTAIDEITQLNPFFKKVIREE